MLETVAPTPWVFLRGDIFCDAWHVTLSHDRWSEFLIWCNKETPYNLYITTIQQKQRIRNNNETKEGVDIDQVTSN